MRRSDGEPSACRSIAAWDMTVLPFTTQIKNGCATIERDCALEVEVILCVRGVIAFPLCAHFWSAVLPPATTIPCRWIYIAVGDDSTVTSVFTQPRVRGR